MDNQRRVARIPIAHIRNINFVIHDSADPLDLAIANLSSLGLGLVIKNEVNEDYSGVTFNGTLFFDNQSFDMKIKVV